MATKTTAQSTGSTLYEVLGVSSNCSEIDLRSAYRSKARKLHPDTAGGMAEAQMAELNRAWSQLGNPARRSLYDELLAKEVTARPKPTPTTVAVPQPAPESESGRRALWVTGVSAQIARLAELAGRSATQTLLLRSRSAEAWARSDYEALVACLVLGLTAETESRVRAARAAGAAPLDLAVAATLIGVRILADSLRRDSPQRSAQGSLLDAQEALVEAQLLDRMWDILAHELPAPLEAALGGNPKVAARLAT